MKIKVYKSLSGAKQGLFAFALTLFLGTAYSQATYTFNYTGSIQTLTAQAGTYDIKMWGADGGSSGQSRAGMGGYSSGTLTLPATTTLYIVVGGTPIYPGAGLQPGGYNGGGMGFAAASGRAGAGATHIATATGVLSALASNTSAVIIVAGGGGGDQNSGIIGHGGGLSGGGTYPGTQTGSSGSTGALFGTFGQGGDVTTSYGGGGGGGWYGGGGFQNNAGSGGSGYIGGVTNAITTMSGTTGFVVKPIVTGNGLVIIQELCNISLWATGTNSLNPVICSGQSLTLSTNAISNYVWSTGATTSTLLVAPTTNTVYSLTATSPSNCTASKSISVTVTSGGQPTLSVVSSTNQTCLGKTATLTASGAVNYTWTNGVTNGVSFYPSTTTTYTVTGDNGCGITTALATISVSPLPLSVVSSATAVCTNNTATLSATAAATSYTWEPGNIIGSSPNLIVNPQATTNYTISATDGTCSGVANISLIANPVPTITSTSSSSLVCPGGTVNLTASGGNNYTWTPVNMTGSNIVVSPISSAAYNVVGDNNFGCLGNSSQVIVVGAQPTVVLGSSSSTICNGSSATLTASGSHSYAWTGGPTTTVYVVSPTQLTYYTMVGTHSVSFCTDTKTISVDVFSPVITVTGNTAVCEGGAVNLSASGATGGYVWNPGNLPFQSVSPSPTSPTTYTVDAIASLGTLTCPVSGTIHVIINPTPIITTVSTPTAICAKQTGTMTASGASTYTWASTNTTVVNASVQVSSPNFAVLVYTVTGTDSKGCEASLSIPVTVHACTGIEQSTETSSQLAVYPNPNNGEFTLQAANDMKLNLVNGLGQQLRNLDLNATNNYKISINNLPNGIYFIVGEKGNQKIIVNK